MTNPIQQMQKVIVAFSERAQQIETLKLTRTAAALLMRGLRRKEALKDDLDGLKAIASFHADEVATWVPPEALADGKGGPFDACDLRHWLALARRARVDAVPAREILRLSESEMSVLSGRLLPREDVPTPAPGVMPAMIKTIVEAFTVIVGEQKPVDDEALRDKLADAMDDVPENWMVRSTRAGSSNLKALSGAGLAGPVVPEVRFSSECEIGPGWRRNGNRRSVDAADQRTMESYAHGPGGDCVFLARPWIKPARLICCTDPHRVGTRVSGPGWWPVEIRVYVVDGVVEGASSYFSWIPFPATPENARTMLEARTLAQRIADEATRQKAFPRYMDIEFARANTHPLIADDPVQQADLAAFGREKIAFTVDFLEVETTDGGRRLVFLEAGPAASPFGGGHPCGFAGVGGPPIRGNRPVTRGVAFQSMAHVVIGDPRTWTDGDSTGRILPWEDVEALALERDAADEGATALAGSPANVIVGDGNQSEAPCPPTVSTGIMPGA